MGNGRWQDRMLQGDVRPARSHLTPLRPDRKYEPVVHLCKPGLWVGVQTAELAVPHNATARRAQLLLAPEWLFSHFPYGAFFPSFRQCHADEWQWPKASTLQSHSNHIAIT